MAAVGTIAVSAAWLAARRSEQQSLRELNGILGTLASSPLIYNESVLEKIHGLSGVELVSLDEAGRPVHSTVEVTDELIEKVRQAPLITASRSISEFPRVTSVEDGYFAARLAAARCGSCHALSCLWNFRLAGGATGSADCLG